MLRIVNSSSPGKLRSASLREFAAERPQIFGEDWQERLDAERRPRSLRTPIAPAEGHIVHSDELCEPVSAIATLFFFPRCRNRSFTLHSVHFHGKNPRSGSNLVSRNPFLRNLRMCLQPQFEQCIFFNYLHQRHSEFDRSGPRHYFLVEASCHAFILSRILTTHPECPQAENASCADGCGPIELC